MPPIYLDHHATTPCDPRVVEKMLPFFTEIFGNPASIVHEHGRAASRAVEDARIVVARFFGVTPPEIVFTAGATESNNIALRIAGRSDHIITSAIEHKSVLAAASESGAELTMLRPDREGFISPDALRLAIRSHTKLISIEAANGEIGTLQDIPRLRPIAESAASSFTATSRRPRAKCRSI
jgi:cysteine desulfurase